MAARRRSHKTNDLPPNLYERSGYYSYRDPRTGREFGLGRNKRVAVNEAVAANMEMMPVHQECLLDRISGKSAILFDELVANFREEISRRKLKLNTMKRHNHRLEKVAGHFAGIPVKNIGIREIYSFLELKASGGKYAMANQYRTLLSDLYKTAMASGLAEANPASETRPFKTAVKLSRLLLEEYLLIREKAEQFPKWFSLCLDLALVTGQREGDLSAMLWSDIDDTRLHIEQEKTGAKIRMSQSTGIEKLGLKLSDILAQLKPITGQHVNVLGGKSARAIGSHFRMVRSATGLTWEDDPPPFHEIRSLSGRLHAEEKGSDFAQAILGHKSSTMTDKYRDGRGREWKEI